MIHNAPETMTPDRKLKAHRLVARFSLITALLIFAWVGLEYLTGKLFGVPQLGPLYGLIPFVIFIGTISALLLRIRRLHPVIPYWSRVSYGIWMTLLASFMVVILLLFYYGLMDPSEYEIYEIEVFNIHLRHTLLTSLLGIWTGTVVEGSFFTLIVAIFVRAK